MPCTQWVFIHVHCTQLKMRRQMTTSVPMWLRPRGAALSLVVEAQKPPWVLGGSPPRFTVRAFGSPCVLIPSSRQSLPGSSWDSSGRSGSNQKLLSKRPFSRSACGTDHGPGTSLLTDGCPQGLNRVTGTPGALSGHFGLRKAQICPLASSCWERGRAKDREKAHVPLSTRQAPTLRRWQSGAGLPRSGVPAD